MDGAVFTIEGSLATPSRYAAGPWDPTMQHGGAVGVLVVRAAERTPSATPMRIARVTLDLLRPVPVAPIEVATTVVREGRKLQLLAVTLSSGGKVAAQASVLKLRRELLALPPEAAPPPFPFTAPGEDAPASGMHTGESFSSGISNVGDWNGPGPASIWFRADRTMVAGEATSPAMRAVLSGDFVNGVSAVVGFEHWTYLNADLSVTLARDPEGVWILVDGVSTAGPEGAAVAVARLGDRRGWFGTAVQSVLLERRAG